MINAILINMDSILTDITTYIDDLQIFTSLLKEKLAMSDYEKICEMETMVNNQHNVIGGRISSLEAKVAEIQLAVSKIMVQLDNIAQTTKDYKTRIDDHEANENIRYGAISNNLKNISDTIKEVIY